MREIHLHAPSGWHDITPEQLLFVALLFEEQLSEAEFLTKCMISFTGIEPVKHGLETGDGELLFEFLDPAGEVFSLSAEEMKSLLDELRWLIDSVGLCRLPEKLGGLSPVDSRLFGVTLEEYLLADQLYANYSASKKVDDLNQLIAVFYRKPGEKWNERKYKMYVNILRSVPNHAKTAVYIWFSGLKKWIIDKYPYVFGDGTTGETSAPSPDEHILRLFTSLNNGDVTRNKEILHTHVHEVFYELNQKLENQQSHV